MHFILPCDLPQSCYGHAFTFGHLHQTDSVPMKLLVHYDIYKNMERVQNPSGALWG